MLGHFLGGKSPGEVAASYTYPEIQALVAHWEFEPPMALLMARYFEVEPRSYEAGEMSTDRAVSLFNAAFASFGAGGAGH